MKSCKFLRILILIGVLFFSISCLELRKEFGYDVPVPKIFRYVDKVVCIYPASGFNPKVFESLLQKPALKYFSPSFKSVLFAFDPEEAKNVKADFYIQISRIGIVHMPQMAYSTAYTNVNIEARCYDSNWKLIMIKKTSGEGNANVSHSPQEEDEAAHKAMNNLAEIIANELYNYK